MIGYCPKCNVPVRGDRCGICHSHPATLRFHPLGDIRPASPYEMGILSKLIPFKEARDYVRRRLVLLSKQPGLDYRKDVFVDGFKIGTLEYVKDRRWKYVFVPTGRGAALFYALTGHVDFEIHQRGHLKGKKISRDVESWEIFSTGRCTGVAVKARNGAKIKDLYCEKVGTKKRSSMKDAISANQNFLREMEREAINMVKKGRANYVAFSGGKDSEVALYIAWRAGVRKAIYANTGLEFPETERFVYNFADYLDIELIEVHPKIDFWKTLEEKGIPTKDNRWCTRYLKIEQLKKFRGVVVDGTRRYESLGRMMRSGNRTLGNLKMIYPLLEWLALDVWLFIKWKGLPYNPLYDMGYERIGCFMCPSMLNSEFHNLKRTHPQLFKTWYDYLQSHGYSHEEIMDGLWRWRDLPPKMKKIRKS